MSFRALQRRAPINGKRGGPAVVAASTHSPMSSCLALNSTSSPLHARRIPPVIDQRRRLSALLLPHTFEGCSFTDLGNPGLFHATPARHILDFCLIVSSSIYLARFLTGYSSLPPHTWAHSANQQTRKEVETTMGMAFNMARNAPMHQRHDKLREATFHVPHELARLNSEAPGSRLEDLGPLSQGKIPWDMPLRRNRDGPALNAKAETRAFLYFPNSSSKATAVFVAVNSELMYPKKHLMRSPPTYNGNGYSTKSIALLAAFRVVYADWKQNRPSVTDRIMEMERLPVICNFQENSFGCVYYTSFGIVPSTRVAMTPLDVTDFGLKTSFL